MAESAGASGQEWTEQDLEHALQIASHIETPLGPAPKRPGKEPALPSSGDGTSRGEREVVSSLPSPPPLPSSGGGGRRHREGSGDSEGTRLTAPEGRRKSTYREFLDGCQNATDPAALNRVLFKGVVQYLDLWGNRKKALSPDWKSALEDAAANAVFAGFSALQVVARFPAESASGASGEGTGPARVAGSGASDQRVQELLAKLKDRRAEESN